MNIYIDLTPADFITLFGLGFVCVAIFLVTGIMLLVTKNPNLISKNHKFRETKLLTTLYGWIYVISSVVTGALLAVAYFMKDLHLTLFYIIVIIVLTMLLIQHFLQRKFIDK